MLEIGVARFQDLGANKVLSVSHDDGDGLAASAIMKRTMDFLKIPTMQVIYDRGMQWNEFLGIL